MTKRNNYGKPHNIGMTVIFIQGKTLGVYNIFNFGSYIVHVIRRCLVPCSGALRHDQMVVCIVEKITDVYY